MDHEEQKQMQKETIYFLEWIAQESGFTENQILENMRPENQKWDSNMNVPIEFFIKDKKNIDRWVGKLFDWEFSMLKPDELFWEDIYDDWENILKSNKYNIEFSRYPIEDWRIIKSKKKVKVKVKSKLKI